MAKLSAATLQRPPVNSKTVKDVVVILIALCTTMHRPVEDVMPSVDEDDSDGLKDDGELLDEEELSAE